jgi:hypothetical protein
VHQHRKLTAAQCQHRKEHEVYTTVYRLTAKAATVLAVTVAPLHLSTIPPYHPSGSSTKVHICYIYPHLVTHHPPMHLVPPSMSTYIYPSQVSTYLNYLASIQVYSSYIITISRSHSLFIWYHSPIFAFVYLFYLIGTFHHSNLHLLSSIEYHLTLTP